MIELVLYQKAPTFGFWEGSGSKPMPECRGDVGHIYMSLWDSSSTQ